MSEHKHSYEKDEDAYNDGNIHGVCVVCGQQETWYGPDTDSEDFNN